MALVIRQQYLLVDPTAQPQTTICTGLTGGTDSQG